MAKIPSTRSGWSAATCRAQGVPHDSETRTARSVPVASSTATVSAAYCSLVYAAGPVGRSDSPLPRPSKVTTRKCRARKPTCAFQNRESMIVQVGISTTVVGGSSPGVPGGSWTW